jgi:hypothetical protein
MKAPRSKSTAGTKGAARLWFSWVRGPQAGHQ